MCVYFRTSKFQLMKRKKATRKTSKVVGEYITLISCYLHAHNFVQYYLSTKTLDTRKYLRECKFKIMIIMSSIFYYYYYYYYHYYHYSYTDEIRLVFHIGHISVS